MSILLYEHPLVRACAMANPRGEMPVLIDGDTTIFESTVIMEFIEERAGRHRPVYRPIRSLVRSHALPMRTDNIRFF